MFEIHNCHYCCVDAHANISALLLLCCLAMWQKAESVQIHATSNCDARTPALIGHQRANHSSDFMLPKRDTQPHSHTFGLTDPFMEVAPRPKKEELFIFPLTPNLKRFLDMTKNILSKLSQGKKRNEQKREMGPNRPQPDGIFQHFIYLFLTLPLKTEEGTN